MGEICRGEERVRQFDGSYLMFKGKGGRRTIRLLTRICMILALRLVRPAKSFWSMEIKKWPNGALMKAP